MELIDKAAVVAELEQLYNLEYNNTSDLSCGKKIMLRNILLFLDTLEVIDPYKRCVQHQSVMDAIRTHAETYSFNTNSELFPQLTKEQQKLWRKEIEYACISGGDAGYLLAKDPRYKENHEVKEVDEQKERMSECPYRQVGCTMYNGHIFECKGVCSWVVDYPKLKELKAQKGE